MSQKILLVDDREDNLMSMESILEPNGYTIIKANSGRQALKVLLSDIDFALILMDVKMPNLNGFETATLIYEREKLRHIPIIFITANHFGEENIYRGYRAGAVDYIYKPVNPDLLRAKVSVFIELYKKNHLLMAQEQRLVVINKNLEKEVNDRIASEHQIMELNRKLVENIDRLESVNKELDGFAFMASHDLQEPLRKIHTFIGILSEKFKDVFDEEGQRYFQSIQKAARRMQALIQDLLTFSQISADNNTWTDCDLNLIIQDVLKTLEYRIREKKAEISIDALPVVTGNPNLISSLFVNLIENAIKYSRKDVTPVISIRYLVSDQTEEGTPHPPQRKFFRVQVEDNGIGFEQQYAEHIFSMFRRLHSVAEFEGTGIGLAICKKIAEKHNGFISAQSEKGKGSVFTITFPVRRKLAALAKKNDSGSFN